MFGLVRIARDRSGIPGLACGGLIVAEELARKLMAGKLFTELLTVEFFTRDTESSAPHPDGHGWDESERGIGIPRPDRGRSDGGEHMHSKGDGVKKI